MTDSFTPSLAISPLTARRFILGRQALWPGRRFSGLQGTAQALRSIEALQLDPLNVVARSHDIALWGRVIDYQPQFLYQLAYQQREFFDYGGGLFMYPMSELPYWRPVMQRMLDHPRWGKFTRENPQLTADVLQSLSERGPLGNRDFEGSQRVTSYRGRKASALALFALWLRGEIMIHHRKGFDRYYDLSERIAPPEHGWAATEEQAEAYFGLKSVAFLGLLREKRWAIALSGYIDRRLSPPMAAHRLASLIDQNLLARVAILDSKEIWLAHTADLPLLAMLEAGQIPSEWQPLGPTTLEEVTFLAPLEIVSARGRARQLFGFDYIWEVYKPVEQRRWGYYTLPVLYGDNLVARLDPRLDRKTGILHIMGFWLEDQLSAADPAFLDALGKGLARFVAFAGARQVDLSLMQPAAIREHIQRHI